MQNVKKTVPILFALFFVFGLSYYLFSVYKPDVLAQVKGTKSVKEKKTYLDSIPLPNDSKELGRNVREDFSQITVACSKSPAEVQKFFRGVLVSKGWKAKEYSEDLLSTVYSRDGERIEVSVLSADGKDGTVFSISFSAN